MSDRFTDYARRVYEKFRVEPTPNKELMDQLKMLPDGELETLRDAYRSNIHIGNEVRRRGLGEGGRKK